MEFTPGEDAVKIFEMKTKDLEYYINWVDKATTKFERMDSKFLKSSTVSIMLLNSIECSREIVHEIKRQQMQQTSLLSYFKEVPQPPNLQ